MGEEKTIFPPTALRSGRADQQMSMRQTDRRECPKFLVDVRVGSPKNVGPKDRAGRGGLHAIHSWRGRGVGGVVVGTSKGRGALTWAQKSQCLVTVCLLGLSHHEAWPGASVCDT